jgi:hypothetical protein
MNQMTNELAPAIPLDQIYPALESNVFGPTKIRAFGEDHEFRSFPYRFQQITAVVKFSEEHCQATPSNGSRARAFEVHPTLVTRVLKHGYTVPDIHAKPGLLSPAEEDAIIQWIALNSQKAKHTTRSQILSYATEHSKAFITMGIVQTRISCYSKAEAVLLMDNCSAHVTPEIFRLLGENHIKMVTFSPHTTNIFQAFDLSFLVCLKRKRSFGWIRMTI